MSIEQSTAEQYQQTFKLPPEALVQAYDLSLREDWRPVTRYGITRGLGGPVVRSVVLFSGPKHSQNPTSQLFSETFAAAEYVAEEIGVDNLSLHVEGVVRNPRKRSYEDTFVHMGELGLFEALLREKGLADRNIKSPEPSKEVVRMLVEDENYGAEAMLGYLILRKLPQIMDVLEPEYSYPMTQSYLLYRDYVELSGFPDVPFKDQVGPIIEKMWNSEHPPELQIKGGQRATSELVAALREETTFIPCLKIPVEKRTLLQRLVVTFNMHRQLGYVAAIAEDLSRGNVAVASGSMHHVASAYWLDGHLEGFPHVVERLHPGGILKT